MAGTSARKRNWFVLLVIAVVVVACAIYSAVSLHQVRSGAGRPANGTKLSVFITNQLAGYREPYT
jgi:hypothetical protein